MTITVAQLDTMPETEAAFKLAACCGSSKWVGGDGARGARFTSREHAARCGGRGLRGPWTRSDWLEAFSHHPRIGEKRATRERLHDGDELVARASSRRVSRVSGAVRDAARGGQHRVRARSSASSTSSVRTAATRTRYCRRCSARLDNTAEDEIAIAADEQRKITRLRLEKLIPEAGADT